MAESTASLVGSELNEPGIVRRRAGRGFSYRWPDGRTVTDPLVKARIRNLAIPPAWTDVWICPLENGHIQAVGTDAAGRRQYRYHERWRIERDREKHDRALAFGAKLPLIRAAVDRDLGKTGLGRERVLAAAVRLIDLGFFRPGDTDYAEDNGSYGLTTLRREHVRCSGGQLLFVYPGKSGKQQEVCVVDERVTAVIVALKRHRDSAHPLFGYRAESGWRDVAAAEVNEYLQEVSNDTFTAKDFRTWHATVLAAVALAVSEHAEGTPSAQKRAIVRAVREVADYLGNTPAVARSSYIDPRVIDRYARGRTISPALDGLAQHAGFGDLATIGSAERELLRLLGKRG